MWGTRVSSKSWRSRSVRGVLLAFLFLFAAGAIVYLPALSGGFIWDDTYLVQENPFFKSPAFLVEVFRHYLFLDSTSVYYRPVQNISYLFDYWLWNTNPFGYHLSNICLHALTGCLLFQLLRSLLPPLLGPSPVLDRRGEIVAFLVALVWVIHPIHNAAVAYVAGRADTLAALFAISAWLIYAKTAPAFSFRNALAWGCASLLVLAAVCSKEIALLWIILFAVYILAFARSRPLGHRVITVASLLVIVALYAALRELPPPRPALLPDAPSAITARVLLMLRALGDYVGLIFCPVVLRMDRIVYLPDAYKTRALWEQYIGFEYLSILGAASLVFIFCFSLNAAPGRKVRLFGGLWFFIGFLPISNLFPLNAQVAEHWIYMPSAGLLLFLAGCVLALPDRFQRLAPAVVLLWCAALGIRTWVRAADWADPERFYHKAIASGSDSSRIRLNLALVYSSTGRLKEAEKELRETVERYPDFVAARINLGINLMQQGKNAEAEPFLKFSRKDTAKNAELFPHTWSAAQNIAGIRYKAGHVDEALKILDEAIVRFPEIWDLVKFKVEILTKTNRSPEAVALVRTWTQAHWWHYESWVSLGRLQLGAGDTDAALASLQQAARLDIHAFEPYTIIANAEMRRNRLQSAYDWEMKAIRRAPGQPLQYVFLASILDQLNRKEEAGEAMRHAREIQKSIEPEPKS